MADNSKPADPKPADPKSDSGGPLNKAQAEFEKYTKRVQAQQAGLTPVFMMPYPQGPGWAVPPSVGMLPRMPGGPGMAPASLTGSIGTSLRLGVDVINAALAGGVRILSGIADIAHGHGHGEGCGCESCCQPDCCEPDCCGGCGCHPGVGSCC